MTRSARWTRAAVAATLILASVPFTSASTARADSAWDFVYGDPGPQNYSRYQVVRAAPDGASFLAGFFTGTFHGLTATDVYRSFVQRIDADGTIAWTVFGGTDTFTSIPNTPDLLRDDAGTLYFRNTTGGSGWSALSPEGVTLATTAAQTADSAAGHPIAVRSGGILQIPFNNLNRVERRTSALTPVWSFDITPYFDLGNIPDLAEAPDGSFWIVGTKLRPLPTSSDAVSMVHISATGDLIAAIKHFGAIVRQAADLTAPSSILTVGDGYLWVNLLVGQPVTASNNAFPFTRAIWSFATDDGHKIGDVAADLPAEQIPNGPEMLGCRGLSLTQTFSSSTGPASVERRVVSKGRRIVLFAQCPRFIAGQLPDAPAGPNDPLTKVLLVYATDGATGTNLRRVSARVMGSGAAVAAIDADDAGNLVVAGSTTDGIVFSGPIERRPSTEASGAERAVAMRNPTGNVLDLPDFKPLTPVRLFDTRTSEAQGAVTITKGRYGGENVLRVRVAGAGGVPAGGVAAVSLNVTAIAPVASGFVTVYPCGARPGASNLNFVAGQVVPNAVIAPVSAAGDVCFASNVDTDLVADVNGWFATGSSFSAVSPTRLFDTRPGEQDGAVAVAKSKVAGSQVLRVHVAGAGGVPATGVGAVSLNVTVAESDGNGFLTVFPCGGQPSASNLNFVTGQVVPNAVIAPVSVGGDVCFASNVPVHVLADVNGWFSRGGGFNAIDPARVFDSRPGEAQGLVAISKQPYGGSTVLRVKVTGINGVPETGVAAVSLNVTVAEPSAAGFVTVYPCGARPSASNLNFVAGQVVPNAVIAPVSSSGEICLFSNVPTHLLADINGWIAT